jgi:Tfp pilus assembly protein FimV
MTLSIRKNPFFSACFKVAWMLGALSSVFSPSVLAANATAEPVATTSANYTVSQSTPIDKLVQVVYANSPLTTAILRKSLVEANPKVITGNPQQRVKAGTTIVVPDHGQIVRSVLTPFAPATETSDPGFTARDYTVRKPWVRFP